MVIPADVFVQIETIRRSGAINMTDRQGVQAVASQRSFYATVVWLEDNPKDYYRALLDGMEPDRPLTDDEQDAIDGEE